MNKHERLKQLVQKYKHAWVFLYGFIYMPWFLWLEHHVTTDYHVIHSALDDKIPFLEVFIIPYLLWFVFIAAVVLYFFFTDVPGFYRLCTMLFTGMTIFLIISTLFSKRSGITTGCFSSGIIFSYVWYSSSTGQIPRPMSSRVFMFTTLWPPVLQFPTARPLRSTKH